MGNLKSMLKTNNTPSTSMQANSGESRMSLYNTLPDTTITFLKNVFGDYLLDSQF